MGGSERYSSRNVVAVSGGADSVYLVYLSLERRRSLLLAHLNHRARGKESDGDQKFVERLCRSLRLPLEVGTASSQREKPTFRKGYGTKPGPGFEEKAREERYAFLKKVKKKHGAERILVAHTADDQVETILMRILEGAGISGLKGIPRSTEEGIERPLLDTWREEILEYLKKHKIPYRVDKSNLDTRLERNWIRHVLIPLLEKRYGKAVKKRIFTLGERFRELDSYIEQSAHNWLGNNIIEDAKKAVCFSRKPFAALPSLLRIKILQILCFERVGTAPNERLLASMDKMIVSGKPSARLNVGRGAVLRCRYGDAVLSTSETKKKPAVREFRFGRKGSKPEEQDRKEKGNRRKISKKTVSKEPMVRLEGPGMYRLEAMEPKDIGPSSGLPRTIRWKEQGRIPPGRMRRLAEGGRWAAFDADDLLAPLAVRPLRAGDRIRPFGLDADKKLKEILIDRKVPREERWGRPVVCGADGKILWIPGVLRSAHAPVTPRTKRTVVLRTDR